jgi:transposase
VDHSTEVFVGIDVAKARNAVAVADGERGGEVRYLGEVDASEESMRRLVRRIAAKHVLVHFCYEAGPTGYGLYRLITALGHPCMVAAPSLIPRKPGDRVKTNRRDAVALAKLLRAGELTPVWVPDAGYEATRDLVRARAAAIETVRVHRQQVSAFMLKHGRTFPRRHQCKPQTLSLDQGPQQNHRRRQTRAPSVGFNPLATITQPTHRNTGPSPSLAEKQEMTTARGQAESFVIDCALQPRS